jgi:hypothetical protein
MVNNYNKFGVSQPTNPVPASELSLNRALLDIHSAMPSVTAKRKYPELIFVKPRFDVYRSVSHQIRAIFADYTPLIEPLALSACSGRNGSIGSSKILLNDNSPNNSSSRNSLR